MREFWEELREHWSDGYWWADRQLLLVVLMTILVGSLELMFYWLKLRLEISVKGAPA